MNYGMRRLLAAWPWFLVAGVSVVVMLAFMMPAAWIVPQFAKSTDGHVNLVDPAGSLWHGSATLMLATGGGAGGGDGATLLPGRVEWRTAFWPLFTGRVRMVMRQTDAMPGFGFRRCRFFRFDGLTGGDHRAGEPALGLGRTVQYAGYGRQCAAGLD